MGYGSTSRCTGVERVRYTRKLLSQGDRPPRAISRSGKHSMPFNIDYILFTYFIRLLVLRARMSTSSFLRVPSTRRASRLRLCQESV